MMRGGQAFLWYLCGALALVLATLEVVLAPEGTIPIGFWVALAAAQASFLIGAVVFGEELE